MVPICTFLPAYTNDERRRVKLLEQENPALRRANRILAAAAVFFAIASQRHGNTDAAIGTGMTER